MQWDLKSKITLDTVFFASPQHHLHLFLRNQAFSVEQAYVGIYYATTKHSLRAALQLSPPDMQRSVTLNYSYLPVLVKLVVTKYLGRSLR